MTAIDTAMVLAAGKGTRMRGRANDPSKPPKPLIEIAGEALLDRMIGRLAEAGVRRVVINLHHKADMIERHLASRDWPVTIVLSDERDGLRETGGGVKKALSLLRDKSLLSDKPFFVCNSDVLWQENHAALAGLAASYQSGHVHLLLAHRDATTGYDGDGDFDMTPANKLKRRQGQRAAYVFAGVQILDPRRFENVDDTVFSLNKIFDTALAENILTGHVLDGVWSHVGTPEGRQAAEARLAEARHSG